MKTHIIRIVLFFSSIVWITLNTPFSQNGMIIRVFLMFCLALGMFYTKDLSYCFSKSDRIALIGEALVVFSDFLPVYMNIKNLRIVESLANKMDIPTYMIAMVCAFVGIVLSFPAIALVVKSLFYSSCQNGIGEESFSRFSTYT